MEKKSITSPGYQIPDDVRQQVEITTLDRIYNWGGEIRFGQ
jgi:hypothetical protein